MSINSNINTQSLGSRGGQAYHERQHQWHTQVELHKNPQFQNTTPQFNSQSQQSGGCGNQCGCSSSTLKYDSNTGVSMHDCPCPSDCSCKAGNPGMSSQSQTQSSSMVAQSWHQTYNFPMTSESGMSDEGCCSHQMKHFDLKSEPSVCDLKEWEMKNPNINPKSTRTQLINPKSELHSFIATPGIHSEFKQGSESDAVQLSGVHPGGLRRGDSMGLGDFAEQHIEEIKKTGDHLQSHDGESESGSYEYESGENEGEQDNSVQGQDGEGKRKRRKKKSMKSAVEGLKANFQQATTELKAVAFDLTAGIKRLIGEDNKADLAKADEIRHPGENKDSSDGDRSGGKRQRQEGKEEVSEGGHEEERHGQTLWGH